MYRRNRNASHSKRWWISFSRNSRQRACQQFLCRMAAKIGFNHPNAAAAEAAQDAVLRWVYERGKGAAPAATPGGGAGSN